MTDLWGWLVLAALFFGLVFIAGLRAIFDVQTARVEAEPVGPDYALIAELEADCSIPIDQVVETAELRAQPILVGKSTPFEQYTTPAEYLFRQGDRVVTVSDCTTAQGKPVKAGTTGTLLSLRSGAGSDYTYTWADVQTKHTVLRVTVHNLELVTHLNV